MSLKSEGGWYWPKVLAGIYNLSLRKQCMKQEPKKNMVVFTGWSAALTCLMKSLPLIAGQ